MPNKQWQCCFTYVRFSICTTLALRHLDSEQTRRSHKCLSFTGSNGGAHWVWLWDLSHSAISAVRLNTAFNYFTYGTLYTYLSGTSNAFHNRSHGSCLRSQKPFNNKWKCNLHYAYSRGIVYFSRLLVEVQLFSVIRIINEGVLSFMGYFRTGPVRDQILGKWINPRWLFSLVSLSNSTQLSLGTFISFIYECVYLLLMFFGTCGR